MKGSPLPPRLPASECGLARRRGKPVSQGINGTIIPAAAGLHRAGRPPCGLNADSLPGQPPGLASVHTCQCSPLQN